MFKSTKEHLSGEFLNWRYFSWKVLIWKLFLGMIVLLPLPAFAQVNSTCQADLANQIEAITDRPEFQRTHWGILAQTIGPDPQTLYAQEADHFFIPASNVKLLTTAAALTRLGADFRIRTSIYQLPSSANQTVLQIVGQGDPSLGDAQLETLAQQLFDRGIRQIERLIADDHYFRGEMVNPTWEWGDLQAGYGAPANSLILNQNSIDLTLVPQLLHQPLQVLWDNPSEANGWQIINQSDTVAANAPEFVDVGRDLHRPILYVRGNLRVGSAAEPVAVSIPQPTEHFLDRFRQILVAQGIQVQQQNIAIDPLPSSAEPIATLESASLLELLQETNQYSNNLYAEAILRILGNTAYPQPQSSLEAGIKAIKQVLTSLGVNPDSYHLADGSGLSRQNLVSPEALVETLQGMAVSPNAKLYRTTLATAGISGTLRNRFQDTAIAGKFQGKSGSLTGIVTLSGYLERENSSQLVLSILVNQTEQPLTTVQATIDRIVEVLWRSSC